MARRQDFVRLIGQRIRIPDHIAIHFTQAQARCVELYVTQGLTMQQTARMLRISKQGVHKHLDAALAKMNGMYAGQAKRVPLGEVDEVGRTAITARA